MSEKEEKNVTPKKERSYVDLFEWVINLPNTYEVNPQLAKNVIAKMEAERKEKEERQKQKEARKKRKKK